MGDFSRRVYRSRVDRGLMGLSVGVTLLAIVPSVVLLWMPETRRVVFLALALGGAGTRKMDCPEPPLHSGGGPVGCLPSHIVE
jgi:hypothetical protein